MKSSKKALLLTVSSVVVAIGVMYFFRWLNDDQPPTLPYNFLWEKVFFSTSMAFGFICGFLEPKAPWRWPLIFAYVHYFSGFSIMKFWGQFPPFELIYLGLLSLPGIAMGYLGSKLGRKAWSSARPVV